MFELLIFFILIMFFIDGKNLAYISDETINLFTSKIFPSLFLFFILTNLLYSTKLMNLITKLLSKPLYLFTNIKNLECLKILILSIVCGSPISSILINDTDLEKDVKVKMTIACSFLSPGFIFGVMGKLYGLNIAFIVFFSSLASHLLYCKIKLKIPNDFSVLNHTDVSSIRLLKKSIMTSFHALVGILGIMIFLNIICYYITLYLDFPYIEITYSFFDITSGLIKARGFQNIYFLSFLTSFLSLSILLQIVDVSNINLLKLIKEKLIISFMSLVITYIILHIF